MEEIALEWGVYRSDNLVLRGPYVVKGHPNNPKNYQKSIAR
jgi:hypothetical protein